jgi:amino acid transporter
LESLLTYGGEHGTLLLLLLTPLFWDVPTIFMVMELNSMMPVNGGYYQWVKRALGIRWACYEGWWTWLYTFVDLAIYPVLFVEYASFFFPEIAHYKIEVCLVVIWMSAGFNILGIVPVGKISMILSLAVVLPFIILFAIQISHTSFHLPPPSLKGIGFSSLGMGLYTVMWNFIGWDNITTYAGEVNKPVKTYLISIFVAFVLTVTVYSISVTTALSSGIDLSLLDEEGFPALGAIVGGKSLAMIIAAGGMASAVGLFSAVLLSISRVPKVMADDELLPKKLNSLHPKYNTPYISIIISAVIVSGMIFWSFGDLVIIDITLYGGALFLEFISLIKFRIKLPHEKRPFKIPLNVPGLCVMILLPLAVYCIALTSALSLSGKMFIPAMFALCSLVSAEVAWRIIVWRKSIKDRR